eukprot:10626623-Alexandrium_andersonii.AAC.1
MRSPTPPAQLSHARSAAAMTLAEVLSLRRSTTGKSLAQSTMFKHQDLDRAASATWIRPTPTTSLKCRGLGRAAARRGFG